MRQIISLHWYLIDQYTFVKIRYSVVKRDCKILQNLHYDSKIKC